VEGRALGAFDDQGGGEVAVGAGEVTRGERDHEERVVLSVLL
jgi:hypothetical protein